MITWDSIIDSESKKDYFDKLIVRVKQEYRQNTVYPNVSDIFKAISTTSFDKAKVVILGQDPYYHSGIADGFSFSVKAGIKIPRSLDNIFIEMVNDLKVYYPKSGNLHSWAEQGVLLLNRVLTVRSGTPNSHRGLGWEKLTNTIISELSKKGNVVFILWGKSAQEVIPYISEDNLVISSSHPSPHSAELGFFGSKPFSKANTYLVEKQLEPIDWEL